MRQPGSQHWSLRLLGGFQLEADGTPVAVHPSGQRLIAFLALNGCTRRAVAAAALWPEVDRLHTHGRLRTVIWRLHRQVPGLLVSRSDELTLAASTAVDVSELRDGTATAESYRLELLPGWYDDWVLLEREHVRQIALRALERLADRFIAEGRCGEALRVAQEAVRLEPLRESAHRAVIAVHLAEDNAIEALRQYAILQHLLEINIGVPPSVKTRDMLQARFPLLAADGVAALSRRLPAQRSWMPG